MIKFSSCAMSILLVIAPPPPPLDKNKEYVCIRWKWVSSAVDGNVTCLQWELKDKPFVFRT
jgi:hypothetical protein